MEDYKELTVAAAIWREEEMQAHARKKGKGEPSADLLSWVQEDIERERST